MAKGLIKMIFARRSIRKYTAKPVSEKDIKTMGGSCHGGSFIFKPPALALACMS